MVSRLGPGDAVRSLDILMFYALPGGHPPRAFLPERFYFEISTAAIRSLRTRDDEGRLRAMTEFDDDALGGDSEMAVASSGTQCELILKLF